VLGINSSAVKNKNKGKNTAIEYSLICFVLHVISSVLYGIKGCVNFDSYGSENTQPMICRASRLCCLVGYQRFGGILGLHEVSC
jgi:hypothetical protein